MAETLGPEEAGRTLPRAPARGPSPAAPERVTTGVSASPLSSPVLCSVTMALANSCGCAARFQKVPSSGALLLSTSPGPRHSHRRPTHTQEAPGHSGAGAADVTGGTARRPARGDPRRPACRQHPPGPACVSDPQTGGSLRPGKQAARGTGQAPRAWEGRGQPWWPGWGPGARSEGSQCGAEGRGGSPSGRWRVRVVGVAFGARGAFTKLPSSPPATRGARHVPQLSPADASAFPLPTEQVGLSRAEP